MFNWLGHQSMFPVPTSGEVMTPVTGHFASLLIVSPVVVWIVCLDVAWTSRIVRRLPRRSDRDFRRLLGWETARGATTPVGNFSFVDLETVQIRCFETGSIAHCAIDIDDVTAFATDQVVMIVSDPVLVQRGRADRLNSTNETLVDQQAQGVVDRLARDRSDVGLGGFGHILCSAVGLVGDGSKNCEPLRGDVESVAFQGF